VTVRVGMEEAGPQYQILTNALIKIFKTTMSLSQVKFKDYALFRLNYFTHIYDVY
jgi:hypothetical protein